MDILILDSWLREHLKTNASEKDIAKYLTLCGPSIEKVEPIKSSVGKDYVYNIEVTTNRVDMMSVRGIAREASVILPEFGFKAELVPLQIDSSSEFEEKEKITLKSNPKLVDRLMGVIMEINYSDKSPSWLKERLQSAGLRTLNPIVDITNYIMTEIGQPTHVFDYDLVKPLIGVRESKKGETITSFDGKTYSLPGGDIVFENDNNQIIDLPGIIGTKNSVVNQSTKRILFFIDNNDPVRIRKTSMTLGIRTVAATLNEKNVDPELAEEALKRAIFLYKSICKAKQISKIYDVYTNKPKIKTIKVAHKFIEGILGIEIKTEKVIRILNNLQIKTVYDKKNQVYTSTPPTFRCKDITIPEDIVEEVARIYGYHNLPNILMKGEIPLANYDSPFQFENKLRNMLSSMGGAEIYSLSLISKIQSDGQGLKLKNPLGGDTEYLRTTLKNSLIAAVNENKGLINKFHLYEISNVYLPCKANLPEELMTLAGIFSKYDYRSAKGILEELFESLHINVIFKKENVSGFAKSKATLLSTENMNLGKFGMLDEDDLIYYELEVEKLRKYYKQFPKFTQISKFPAQIEDVTFTFPEKTMIGRVFDEIRSSSNFVSNIELTDIFNNSFTFRIWYQSSDKTLTDETVEQVRNVVIQNIKKKFNGVLK